MMAQTAMQPSRPLALITGASSGIGATFARHLAARGYDLVLVARRRDRLEETARAVESSHSVRCEILPADLTRDAELKTVEERIASAPNLEFLVNNAGFGVTGLFFAVPLEGQDQQKLSESFFTNLAPGTNFGFKMASRVIVACP